MAESITLPDDPGWIETVRDKAFENMEKHESCVQSILAAFMEAFGVDDTVLLRSAGALHGGMLCSYTCGVHVAGAMVLGMLVGRARLEQGPDGLFPVVLPAQALMRRLNEKLGHHSCLELTGVDFTDLEAAMAFYASGDHEACITRVKDGAEAIARFLQELGQRGELFRA